MRKFIITLSISLCAALSGNAQTYLDHLQQSNGESGKVTVSESKEIDDLVNGKTPANTATATTTGTAANTPSTTTGGAASTAANSQEAGEGNAEASVDMSKKVMANSYKTTGYRVQVYAGGNTRADKQKAEKTGNALKAKFPSTPVYVHFYSPRWICRMGNYRTMEEANEMLRKVRALGYSQACIVKGKITVQY